jgi:uncharacterized membrane protein
MISKTLPAQMMPDKRAIFKQLLAESRQNRIQIQRQLNQARAMKAMPYDFIAIFEATGLQPEIIQSL